MNSPTLKIASIVLALGAAAGAQASTSVHISIGASPAVVVAPPHPRVVHVPAHQVHGAAHAHARHHRHDNRQYAGCWAPRWDPHVRYMPGQVVRRHGDLFVARRISARVWNENSPPEWTRQYWAPAVCR